MLEAAIDAEIEKVKSGPIADWEIEKAHNNAHAPAGRALTSTLQRAVQLGEYALFYDDPNLINTRARRHYQKVTAADVQRVAKKYLTQGESVGRDHDAERPPGPSKGRPAVKRQNASSSRSRRLRSRPLPRRSSRRCSRAGNPSKAAGPSSRQGAGHEGNPQGLAAETAGGRSRQRRPPDRDRGPSRAAGLLPDDRRRRRRLLRSRRRSPGSPRSRRR